MGRLLSREIPTLNVVRWGLVKPDRPENARRDDFRLGFRTQLHAPLDTFPVDDVESRTPAAGVPRHELKGGIDWREFRSACSVKEISLLEVERFLPQFRDAGRLSLDELYAL